MLETPLLLVVPARPAAIIKITVARPDMPAAMGPAIRELREVLRAQGVAPAGALFTHHLRMDAAVFDFEVGIPVDCPIVAAGRVQPGGLPSGKIARAVYRGGYEGLPEAWRAFHVWIADSGYQRTADLWEVYLTGPDEDPADWRTELNQPVQA